MPEYHVVWEIDLKADSPEDAARQALEIQRDPFSTSTVFKIYSGGKEPTYVDLEDSE